jgi:GTP pyrophosphokinase
VIPAKWISDDVSEYMANLKIKGIDSVGLVNRITQLISNDLSVNIRAINISGEGGVFEGDITVAVRNKHHLQNIIGEIQKVEGIKSVTRHIKNS